ncbi:polymorphic toxin type 44 domain-containing protein [Achromobacter arsenitoxydans]|uniref:Bacterial toxin 44 domain-containing protein n=1 Tax=Achromobacter arsenitoxydans SY8 TaxID=477184 RepID=H0FBA0_9BURK|nr:polymorphic toxin type 44 domain-containing protein [Achromobacter arsenitoxydans]EHK64365.1 hypothetical protein KYC_20284 [Achromobacter arsenitoxydans SY8]
MAGHPIIRIGDSTTHGGTVLQGVSVYTIDGRVASGVGHLVRCPKCKGTFPIVQGVASFTVDGISLAVEGMRTSCGAELIASQRLAVLDPGPGGVGQAGDVTQHLASSLVDGSERDDRTLSSTVRRTTCNHADTAFEIAEYMVREMKTNPFTIRGREISDANQYDLAAHARQLEKLPWYSRAMAGKSYSEAAIEQKLAAYALWADIVGPGQPWDHKAYLRKSLITKGIFNDGWQRYGDFDYYYDIWSNIHYGYVGVALGFSVAELINGAGLAQAMDDAYGAISKGNFPTMQDDQSNGRWPASADDVPDHLSIKLGCDLYSAVKPHELTALALLKAIAAVPLPWGVGHDKAKELHNCNRGSWK